MGVNLTNYNESVGRAFLKFFAIMAVVTIILYQILPDKAKSKKDNIQKDARSDVDSAERRDTGIFK